MSKIVGIDLGTTFSAAAVMENGEPKIVENKEGGRTTPSIVAMNKTGERTVGTIARRQQITNPQNTIFSVKRLIGRRFSDAEVQKDRKFLPYAIKEASDGGVEVKMGDKWYKPAEISAMILQKIKQDVEEKIGEKITDAVITCPAYFDDSQRKATKVAGEIAGFNVRIVLNEPTAAALAYGLTKKTNQQILVYDFGGGTFDVSVLDVRKDPDTVEVVGVGGDTHLGGDDFDQKIMSWIIGEFKKDQGIDLSKDQLALQRIKEVGEKAKIELSTAMETEINLPFITSDSSGPKHLYLKFTRSKLENLVGDYIEKSIELVKETLKTAKIEIKDIEEIVLVGGQTRMPAMQEAVRKFFGKEPSRSINPDEVVALGAAIEGAIIGGEAKEVLLLDATPLSLGIETLGSVNTILIPKNTIYPTAKSQIFSTAGEGQTSVEIHVLQGERPMASDNKTLGRFILDGIPPAPRGIPQIEVSFDVDTNGILNVSAKDKATGKSQSIRIESSMGMSKEEVEKMKKEAEIYNEEDKKKKELIEARNLAENLVYTCQKTLKDAGDKIDKGIKADIEERIKGLEKAKDSDNIEDIKAKTLELSNVIQKAGAEMYKNAKPEEKPEQKKEKPKEEGGTQEGEYKEK
ncbi:MAG: molecular chaperone DnaK [Candidatus Nealsonbacteria bacterium RIFCSPHIGHO2_01_FULL_38_55]|uniref:Chaperone protein DnaK n=2 Tax=Candidatus Nealsoniibacteriota TaxID=1817911 RepID=A0A1G2EIU3_9BACT|nr:MAG: Chaperone protein DnaK [Parcubacteria group bacterium GW2011_GWA2_38_27]KKQ96473.1 MAG: Chaperone protein DnaK [Parcubacteria group bacterium GW2011_GWC2_39_11]OGZ19679.1 MAG: molecular chaperone DnaK [Candidatus Nealsonbacteria bacterium RIFCSPHIGHO2_01_FULL_38_55]OGZ20748.1 MAG: molecular chaperone DnaK [Candidatus Nealsonbacteria bacterium RIFCSPHIGHO2_02_38_10]OGZ20970.1 MAG: molecular chaperone DnaK [Candidatus Nealsonbacteria bacterium RIFCSPHIGHO2_02_FULL_38_75]OGZ23166.1 MAG: m